MRYVWAVVSVCLLFQSMANDVDETLPKPPTFVMPEPPPYKGPLVGVSQSIALQMLMPLVRSERIDDVIKLMKGLGHSEILSLTQKLSEDESASVEARLRTLLGVIAAYFETNQAGMQRLFDCCSSLSGDKKRPPMIYVAFKYGYETSVPLFLVYAKDKASKESFIVKSVAYALDKNDVAVAKKIIDQYGHDLTKEQLSSLLWQASDQDGSSPEFVTLLHAVGADINYAHDGYTPLMRATVKKNLPFVKTLIAAGADKGIIIKPEIGTALQLAIEYNAIKIEIYLRELGAGNELQSSF